MRARRIGKVTLAGCLLVVLALHIPVTSFGTPRFYSDKDAISSNGRWRVTARSPDNLREKNEWGGAVAFQRNFVFTLHDVAREKVVWQIDQGETGSPMGLWVNDEGRVVYWASGEECFLVTPDGKRTRMFALRDVILPGHWDRYVSETTAGPMWTHLSRWYFADAEKRTLFVIRTWWGHRFVCDLEHGALVEKPGPGVCRVLEERERDWALAKLESALADPEAGEDYDHDLNTAAHLTGVLKIEAGIPALRKLEARWETSVSGGRYLDDGEPNYRIDQRRQLVQLSLRRMGQRPAGYPPILLLRSGERDSTIPARADVPARPPDGMSRAEAAEKVRIDMSYREVMALMGAADSNDVPVDDASEWGLDFDVDPEKRGEQAFTLRAEFVKEKLVRVSRISPPAWQDSLHRDRQFGF